MSIMSTFYLFVYYYNVTLIKKNTRIGVVIYYQYIMCMKTEMYKQFLKYR